VKNAQVTLSMASLPPVVFSDTLLKRTSTERYTDSIVAYYSKSVNYQFDTGYHLSVINPQLGEVHADLVTPGVGTIEDLSGFLVRNPDQATPGEHISVRLLLPSPHSGGYLLRMFVEFRIDTLSQTVERRWEVPVQITTRGELIYPTLRENSHAFNSNSEDFAVEAYQTTRGDILSKYIGYNPRLLRVSFDLYQFDVNLYNYYNVANGFRDPLTLRSDSPDYTNIVDGLGVFGAITFNRLKEDLP
jgi:hypothetical protein